MADDELRDADRFERYLDALVSGGRPSPDDVGEGDEAEMARTAAELAAAADPADEPDGAFIEQLRLRMRHADQGIEAVQVPPPVHEPGSRSAQRTPAPGGIARFRVTRRALLQTGLGAAAGLAAGALGLAASRTVPPPGPAPGPSLAVGQIPLVGGNGAWQPIAKVSEVPPGKPLRFTTTAFAGYLINDGHAIWALTSVCTHMGCTLFYRPDWNDLRCPCHGASFDLQGELANGKEQWKVNGGYAGDAQPYPTNLPPLVRPGVMVDDENQIWVWTVQG